MNPALFSGKEKIAPVRMRAETLLEGTSGAAVHVPSPGHQKEPLPNAWTSAVPPRKATKLREPLVGPMALRTKVSMLPGYRGR